MRVSLMVLASFSFLVACSSEPSGSPLKHRSSASAGAAADQQQSASEPRAPAAPGKPSSDDPVPQNGAPPPPTPDAGPPAGSCANPNCKVGNNGTQCLATDSDGQSIEMDCQGGGCTCWTGDQDTTDFPGSPRDVGDAKTLFFANCQCL